MQYKTGCKINLGLQILDKREDGYHNLETIFYPLAMPFDVLHIEKKEEQGIVVSCSISDIDTKVNTLTKAYELYTAYNPVPFGITVHLEKNVPHGAGLGGGSANGAMILQYLQNEAPKQIPFKELVTIATKIGADVPFFLYNVPCVAKSIGEILQPKEIDLSKYFMLLVMPTIQVSTVWAFKKLAEEKKLLTSKKEQAKRTRSQFLGENFFINDFEAVVLKEHRELEITKEIMLQSGAVFAQLSGTGSALFALFEHKNQAEQTINSLSKNNFFQEWKYVIIDKG